MKNFFVLILILFFLNGCSHTPEVSDMVPKSITVKYRYSKPVTIVISGQLITEGYIQVSNQALSEVLRLSIEKEQLFSSVNKHSINGFLLEVSIIGYEPPKFGGFKHAATLITHWKLTDILRKEVVFEDYFKKTHVAAAMSSFSAGGRSIIANGEVVKDTIKEGLMSISKLEGFR